jgi:uncharacterized membrane protein
MAMAMWSGAVRIDQGFVKRKNKPMTMFMVPASASTAAAGISDDGQIVGSYYDTIRTAYRGFHRLSNGKFKPIDPPIPTTPNDGVVTILTGVNRRGQIIGYYYTGAHDPFGQNQGAFLYDNGIYTSLNPPDTNYATPLDINNDGTVLVSSLGRHYLWDDDRLFPITLNLPGTILFYEIAGMNDNGQLVGDFAVRTGTFVDPLGMPRPILSHHGFIATPK